ncbi:RNA-directed DNA polymerase, eukaryota [Tanacetum coccineum]
MAIEGDDILNSFMVIAWNRAVSMDEIPSSQNVVVQAANRIGPSPTYYSQSLRFQRLVEDYESIRSKFFNGDSSYRKISWVAWDNVLASKLNGGLGVSSFFALNRSLLLKWVWRFISGDGSLLCKVIQAIYGSKDLIFHREPINPRFVLYFTSSQNVVVQAANRIGPSPTYYSQSLRFQRLVEDYESIRSKFFNGDSSYRKISWVAWDNVLASKLNGGLGVSSFFALNRSLLLKWVWRFISGDGSLLCKVIQAIYGSKDLIFHREPINPRFIVSLLPESSPKSPDYTVTAVPMDSDRGPRSPTHQDAFGLIGMSSSLHLSGFFEKETVVTAETGLLKKLTFLQTNGVVLKQCSESMIVMGLGLGLATLCGLVTLTTVSPKQYQSIPTTKVKRLLPQNVVTPTSSLALASALFLSSCSKIVVKFT